MDAATYGIGPRRPRFRIGVDLARSQSPNIFVLLLPATQFSLSIIQQPFIPIETLSSGPTDQRRDRPPLARI